MTPYFTPEYSRVKDWQAALLVIVMLVAVDGFTWGIFMPWITKPVVDYYWPVPPTPPPPGVEDENGWDNDTHYWGEDTGVPEPTRVVLVDQTNFAQAMDAAQAGDHFYFEEGVYRIDSFSGVSGTAAQPIVYECQGSNCYLAGSDMGGADHVILKGFTFGDPRECWIYESAKTIDAQELKRFVESHDCLTVKFIKDRELIETIYWAEVEMEREGEYYEATVKWWKQSDGEEKTLADATQVVFALYELETGDLVWREATMLPGSEVEEAEDGEWWIKGWVGKAGSYSVMTKATIGGATRTDWSKVLFL